MRKWWRAWKAKRARQKEALKLGLMLLDVQKRKPGLWRCIRDLIKQNGLWR